MYPQIPFTVADSYCCRLSIDIVFPTCCYHSLCGAIADEHTKLILLIREGSMIDLVTYAADNIDNTNKGHKGNSSKSEFVSSTIETCA